MTEHLLNVPQADTGRVSKGRGIVTEVVEANRREADLDEARSSTNRRVTLAGWSSCPFPRVKARPVSPQELPRMLHG